MEKFKLSDNHFIPVLGFGTWQLVGDECYNAVLAALEVGFRHIDTAERYGNHTDVARAIRDSGVPRSELFITSKIWRDHLREQDVYQQCQLALAELETEYLDLYLIHWPNRDIPIAETLVALQELVNKKMIRSIGVSNFTIRHMNEALATGVQIVNNQIELHPSFGQFELKKYADEHQILLTAYSPLGQGQDVLLPEISEIAKKHGKTPSQVILNWIISRGIVAIPRSSKKERIQENFGSVGWGLSGEDIETINNLNRNNRILSPEFSEFGY